MELSRTQKVLLGAASIWPLVYIFLFIAIIIGFIALAQSGPQPILGTLFPVVMVVHLLTILLTFALTVFYIIHAVKNERLEGNMRIVWIVLFFFGGMIAHPIYWYLEIWRERAGTRVPGHLTEHHWSERADSAHSSAYTPPTEMPDWR